jgi:hypothetical protein
VGDEGQFDIDTTSEPVRVVCTDTLKSIQRQARYLLKQKYFNDVLANAVPTKSHVPNLTNAQWKALVNMWSSPEHRTSTCHYHIFMYSYIVLYLISYKSSYYCKGEV